MLTDIKNLHNGNKEFIRQIKIFAIYLYLNESKC